VRLARPVADAPDGIARVEIQAVARGSATRRSDLVSVEEPLQIRLVHGPATARVESNIAVTMRTPGDDDALALGFLHGEGVVRSPGEVVAVTGERNVVTVELSPTVEFDTERLTRNVYTTSSCGVCGKASIEAVHVPIPDRAGEDSFTIDALVLGALPDALRARQAAFAQTGGIHASATFGSDGRVDRAAEDVGRHNALDKLIGSYLADGELPLTGLGLIFSGRASFELVQKAALAGCPLVAAIGPPSSLAVELAAEQRMTLVGFLRQDRCNIYTLPHRVLVGG
jgi:FdhD protein